MKGVLWPDSKGLPKDKVTIANALKAKGYATGCFGKWHLGDVEGYLPTDRGFDYYYGIPYSNDMFIGHIHSFSQKCVFTGGYNKEKAIKDQKTVQSISNKAELKKILNNASPLFENHEIIEYPCEQATTTYRYFNKAMEFIKSNKNTPFFVYLTPFIGRELAISQWQCRASVFFHPKPWSVIGSIDNHRTFTQFFFFQEIKESAYIPIYLFYCIPIQASFTFSFELW